MGNVIIGILIPFLGTTLGSGLVFFMRKKEINKKVQKLLIGFAAGVMMAASIWSLLMPALNMTAGKFAWVPVAVGFMSGIVFLLILDTLVPHQHLETEKAEGLESNFKKTTKLVLAVTIHNIPEGMATGVVFAGALIGNASMTIAGAIVLAVGMAIQNFPEGAIISMPLKAEGISKWNSFRNSRTNICSDCYCIYSCSNSNSSIYIIFCSRCNDLCSSRRTSTRITSRRTY